MPEDKDPNKHYSGLPFTLEDLAAQRLAHSIPCPRCFGRGQVGDPERVPFDVAYQVRCPDCKGTRLAAEQPNPFAEEYPLLCFEQDLDAGVAAGKQLAEKGFAPL